MYNIANELFIVVGSLTVNTLIVRGCTRRCVRCIALHSIVHVVAQFGAFLLFIIIVYYAS